VVALALLVVVAVVLLSVATRLTPLVRERAIAALSERLQSQVELDAIQVAAFPRPAVIGSGLRIRHHGRSDVPPLLAIDSYSASAGLFGLVQSPMRLRTVELDGLVITIPPRDDDDAGNDRPAAGPRIAIDRVVSRRAKLQILPRDPGKLPRVFEIHDVTMRDLGNGGAAAFHALLTNPTPRGDIVTDGAFGPWRGDEPGLTPVKGQYAFTNANLDTIKGIGGMLSSTGTYDGMLSRIEVRGETDTPDFSVDVAAQPVPLHTRFHAVVDGTNGNTWLEEVEARIFETVILARGAVVRTQDVKGRKTTLDVTIDNGRIEDVLKLGMKATEPFMTGRMRLKTAFVLPAGEQDVIEKLQLDGTFTLEQARFSKVDVQRRINMLSQRGRGGADGDGPSVVSNLSARFVMRQGTLDFHSLTFAVPGAVVQLAGSMDLRRETLDFGGDLLLDAELSETVTGFKSVLAKIAQPLFRRRGGGSSLPIRIDGSFAKPAFGLDVKRALLPGR
jgi:hypothetical protein